MVSAFFAKKCHLLRLACLTGAVVACLLPSVLYAARVWESGMGDRFIGATLENLLLVRDSDGTEALRLADNEAGDDDSVDLLLRGNSPADFRSQRYQIRSDNVIIDTVLPLFGTGSMRFAQPDNRVLLSPRPGALLGETSDMGSFSIDFWVFPYSQYDEEDLFSRYGSFLDAQGRVLETGIRLFFRSNRLVFRFRNMLIDRSGRIHDVELTGQRVSRLRVWQHIAFVYDDASGKFSRLVDGVEDGVLWMTDTGRYGGTPLRAAFPAGFRRQAQLGGGFRGRIEDFRIRRGAWSDSAVGRYSTAVGRVTSRVVDMGTSNARLNSISWKADTMGGSAVLFEYRVADHVFPADDEDIPWIRVRNQTASFDVSRGRYLQWRAMLLGAEKGRYTPVLKSVRLVWDPAHRPDTPVGLIARAGDGRITLRWRANMDRIAGYRIYLGTEKGEYLHPDSPLDVPLGRIDADNPGYVIRNLENDRLYYITITAYTADGMQSAYSREVRARPAETE